MGLSTLLHWLAGRRLDGLWILPDEGVYAERALGFWHHGRLPVLHGAGTGYSVLYPIVAGVPLAVGDLGTGYASLKLWQALVVSLAAVPVFAYGRRLMPPAYALLAAVLTVASPILLYSGLVMTEALFYPIAAWTLLAIVRAVGTGTRRDQALALVLIVAAVLTRTQAVVLVPVFALAALVDAGFARAPGRLRAFWPVGAVLAAGIVAVAVHPAIVGSYAVTLRGNYPLGSAIALSVEHLALIVLSTAVLPGAALLLMAVTASRGREPDAVARALVATTLSALLLVPLQVGFFAARFSPHLLQRDLAALPPLLFVVFALWLARGAPRPLPTTLAAAFALTALLLLTPWNRLATAVALPDSFTLALLERLRGYSPADVVAVGAPVVLLALVVLPRRVRLLLPAIALFLLVVASVSASDAVTARVQADQRDIVGTPRDWIDRTATGDVAYFYDGEAFWNTVWQEQFWNRRIQTVVAAAPHPVPGPLPQIVTRIPPSGYLPIRERWVVASDAHRFVGTPAAHLAQTNLDVTGLTLWHLDGRARLSLITQNVQPNGDMTTTAKIHVYGCDGGKLQLTLLPKATKRLHILVNGRLVVNQDVDGQEVWQGLVPAPARTPHGACTYTLVPQGLLGSTVIQFLRG